MRFLLVLLVGLFLRAVPAAAAIEVGSKVVLIRPIVLKTEGGASTPLTPGSVLDVRSVEGQTLTVGSPRIGRVEAADVIPLAEAEKYFTALIEKNPKDAVAWTVRGKFWFHHLQQDKAIADFDESLLIRPDSESMTLRAFAWKRKGDKQKAMSLLDEAIKFNPNDALAWRVRGATFASLADYPKTVAHYTESIRIDPENPESLLHRAIILSGCEDPSIRNGKQAVEDATKACEFAGYDVPLYLNCLSFAYSEAGDFDTAIKWQKKVVELSPNGQNKAAEDRIEQFRQKKPYRTKWR